MVSEREIDAAERQASIEAGAHYDALPHTRLSSTIDRMIRGIGDTVSWIWGLLLVVIVMNVVLRYAFGEGRIEFEELQWHLYSVGFLVGLSYCVESDDHIRVDFLHTHFSPRLRGWIELYGILLLLLPFVALALIYSAPFIGHAYTTGEVSSAPGGLPYRWAIKSALFGGFALLGLAAVSRLLRVSALLFSSPAPIADPTIDAEVPPSEHEEQH